MIFVDTSFWAGVINGRDDQHADAARLLLAHPIEPLLTTDCVRGETWTLVRRRMGFAGAVRFLDLVERTKRLAIHPLDRELDGEALAWLRRHDEREYSYVDATSFAVMRKLRIRNALAFDGDFSAAGFVELRT